MRLQGSSNRGRMIGLIVLIVVIIAAILIYAYLLAPR
jgi:hypothetical protein